MPVAHDAQATRLLQQTGFTAVRIGGLTPNAPDLGDSPTRWPVGSTIALPVIVGELFARRERDVILAANHAPMSWYALGIHVWFAPPFVTSSDRAFVPEPLVPPASHKGPRDGSTSFTVAIPERPKFTSALFGEPARRSR